MACSPQNLFACHASPSVQVEPRLTSWCWAGKAKYDSKKHALVWKVKRYQGMSEHALTASVELIATTRERKPWGRPPIAMAFQARTRIHVGVYKCVTLSRNIMCRPVCLQKCLLY